MEFYVAKISNGIMIINSMPGNPTYNNKKNIITLLLKYIFFQLLPLHSDVLRIQR
jgi:hypothetical protein